MSQSFSLYTFLANDGSERLLKKLAGRTNVEVALSQLDTLTKEENLIVARSSEVTYKNNVRAIEDGT